MDTPRGEYRIRLARADEVARIRQIEDEAGTMFSGLGLIDEALDPSFPLDAVARLIGERQVWVACQEDDVPVGMVIASVREGAAYIEELDVVPAHGRRGLGSRLVECVCEWAKACEYRTVTLSTFRDLPWNGPFYRKRGFRDLSPADWTADMHAIREREVQHGLRVDTRVFMRRVMIETGGNDMVTVGLFVRLEARAGKERELEEFLKSALPLAQEEAATVAWFAVRFGPSSFAIFDVFPDDAGRQAHLTGRIAAALMARAGELLSSPPVIEKLDTLASKLPAA